MKKRHLILIGCLILGMIVIPHLLTNYFTKLLTLVLIFSLVSLSIDMLLGYTGLRVLGHAAFFALGAYTAGILVTRYHASFWVTFCASIVVTCLFSALFGILVLRGKGFFFLLISLALDLIIYGMAYRWASLTGGESGINDIPRPDLVIHWDLQVTTNFYYFVLIFFGIFLTVLILLIKSPFGKTLVGIKDAPDRMSMLGYNVWLHQYLALIIGGIIAGIGGNLYAYYNAFVGPTSCSMGTAMEFVLMVVIGGPGTMVGACIGAFIIVFLREIISLYTERWLMFLGIAYIITGLYAPNGIIGLLQTYIKKD